MFVTALSFVRLMLLPVDFSYGRFAVAPVVNGVGMGTRFQNLATVLLIGSFFSPIIGPFHDGLVVMPAAPATWPAGWASQPPA